MWAGQITFSARALLLLGFICCAIANDSEWDRFSSDFIRCKVAQCDPLWDPIVANWPGSDVPTRVFGNECEVQCFYQVSEVLEDKHAVLSPLQQHALLQPPAACQRALSHSLFYEWSSLDPSLTESDPIPEWFDNIHLHPHMDQEEATIVLLWCSKDMGPGSVGRTILAEITSLVPPSALPLITPVAPPSDGDSQLEGKDAIESTSSVDTPLETGADTQEERSGATATDDAVLNVDTPNAASVDSTQESGVNDDTRESVAAADTTGDRGDAAVLEQDPVEPSPAPEEKPPAEQNTPEPKPSPEPAPVDDNTIVIDTPSSEPEKDPETPSPDNSNTGNDKPDDSDGSGNNADNSSDNAGNTNTDKPEQTDNAPNSDGSNGGEDKSPSQDSNDSNSDGGDGKPKDDNDDNSSSSDNGGSNKDQNSDDGSDSQNNGGQSQDTGNDGSTSSKDKNDQNTGGDDGKGSNFDSNGDKNDNRDSSPEPETQIVAGTQPSDDPNDYARPGDYDPIIIKPTYEAIKLNSSGSGFNGDGSAATGQPQTVMASSNAISMKPIHWCLVSFALMYLGLL